MKENLTMNKPCFSIIITTYNRCSLVGRAIDSVLLQDDVDVEIIVVDDASTDDTQKVVEEKYPQVKYIKQERNQGPGSARNRGLREASKNWAILFDDDDTLLPGSLRLIWDTMNKLKSLEKYPVLNFAHSNGRIEGSFQCLSIKDYLQDKIQGDFIPVIQVNKFLESGFNYPDTKIGGEHLLWWEVAKKCGIPTWAICVAKVHSDAPTRLTSFEAQAKRALEYAQLQDRTIELFENELSLFSFPKLRDKWLGSIIYWKLAGQRQRAVERVKKARKKGVLSIPTLYYLLLFFCFMPSAACRRLFVFAKKVRTR
jgi:GalNAc5-diNAcBac-PP-undecaprenol beta-1,3-glucosyltransferase